MDSKEVSRLVRPAISSNDHPQHPVYRGSWLPGIIGATGRADCLPGRTSSFSNHFPGVQFIPSPNVGAGTFLSLLETSMTQ